MCLAVAVVLSLFLSLPRLPFPSFFAVFPSSSRPVSPVMLPPSRTAFIRSDFPCSYSPSFPFIYGSPFVSTSLLVFSMRDRPRYILSLFLAPFLRGRPLVRCPSLPFSVLLAASTRNFLLSRSSWITSRRFSFFSRLPILSRPLLAFFFSIFVCILLHFSFSSTSLRSVVHSPPLSLSPLVSLDSLTCALPRFSAAVSYRAWAPCRLVVIVAAFDRSRPNSHVPIYGKIRARPRLLNVSHPSSFIFVFRFRRDDFSPTVVLYIFFRVLNKHVNRGGSKPPGF